MKCTRYKPLNTCIEPDMLMTASLRLSVLRLAVRSFEIPIYQEIKPATASCQEFLTEEPSAAGRRSHVPHSGSCVVQVQGGRSARPRRNYLGTFTTPLLLRCRYRRASTTLALVSTLAPPLRPPPGTGKCRCHPRLTDFFTTSSAGHLSFGHTTPSATSMMHATYSWVLPMFFLHPCLVLRHPKMLKSLQPLVD